MHAGILSRPDQLGTSQLSPHHVCYILDMGGGLVFYVRFLFTSFQYLPMYLPKAKQSPVEEQFLRNGQPQNNVNRGSVTGCEQSEDLRPVQFTAWARQPWQLMSKLWIPQLTRRNTSFDLPFRCLIITLESFCIQLCTRILQDQSCSIFCSFVTLRVPPLYLGN